MILFLGSSTLAEVLEILYANRVFCHVGAQFRGKVTKKQADCQTTLSLSLQTHEDFTYS